VVIYETTKEKNPRAGFIRVKISILSQSIKDISLNLKLALKVAWLSHFLVNNYYL
jgi:hypothetical protein